MINLQFTREDPKNSSHWPALEKLIMSTQARITEQMMLSVPRRKSEPLYLKLSKLRDKLLVDQLVLIPLNYTNVFLLNFQ